MSFWRKQKKENSKKPLKENESQQEEKIEVKKENWFEPEGELAIDAYQTENEVVVQSTIAGVNAEDLDITIENEILTIRGDRQKPVFNNKTEKSNQGNYFYQECYWGPFSKEIVLPEEVDPSKVEAIIKQGILTIKIPKIQRKRKRKISVKE